MTEVFEESSAVPLADACRAHGVLVVTADPLLRERFEEVLSNTGWRMRAFSCGADALTALAAPSADPSYGAAASLIVMLDEQLPDGAMLRRAIRQQPIAAPAYLIVLTSAGDEAAMNIEPDAAPDDYLERCAGEAEFGARLRAAQRILRLEQSLHELTTQHARLVTIDALTGANNRAYFMNHLYRDLEQARRFGGMVSVLVLDVDHFKRINDRYGHAAGDEVLKELARRVGASLRDCDWYARVGDEEFAVVLPQTSLPGARVLAERIRKQVSVAPVQTGAGAVAVSISIGVSGREAFRPGEAATVERLFALACRCVHQSKARGRDCVTVPEDLAARSATRKY